MKKDCPASENQLIRLATSGWSQQDIKIDLDMYVLYVNKSQLWRKIKNID